MERRGSVKTTHDIKFCQIIYHCVSSWSKPTNEPALHNFAVFAPQEPPQAIYRACKRAICSVNNANIAARDKQLFNAAQQSFIISLFDYDLAKWRICGLLLLTGATAPPALPRNAASPSPSVELSTQYEVRELRMPLSCLWCSIERKTINAETGTIRRTTTLHPDIVSIQIIEWIQKHKASRSSRTESRRLRVTSNALRNYGRITYLPTVFKCL